MSHDRNVGINLFENGSGGAANDDRARRCEVEPHSEDVDVAEGKSQRRKDVGAGEGREGARSEGTQPERLRYSGPDAARRLCEMQARSLAANIGFVNLANFFDRQRDAIDYVKSKGASTWRLKPGGKAYPRDRPVRGPADVQRFMLVVARGRIGVYLTCGDARYLVTELGPLAVFGDLPSFGLGMFGAEAEAISACQLLALDPVEAERAIRRAGTAIEWLKQIGPRFIDYQLDRDQLAFGTITSRVAALLLKKAKREKSDAGQATARIQQVEIANELGMFREQVSICLRKLRSAGLVEVKRRKITLLDREGLVMLSTLNRHAMREWRKEQGTER